VNTCPININKPKIAIFDLTDCEGCELQFLALDQKITDFTSKVDIVNWRLVDNKKDEGPYDICLIEGTIITDREKEMVLSLREKSKIVIAIGACACNGGIASIIDKNRAKFSRYVYGKDYKPVANNALALDQFIKVDYYLNGCPINPAELEDFLTKLISGQQISNKYYPVCYECKNKENLCLLLQGQPCLGPITLGGCGAACPSKGIKCYGCWGKIKDANIPALSKILINQGRTKQEVKQILELFIKN